MNSSPGCPYFIWGQKEFKFFKTFTVPSYFIDCTKLITFKVPSSLYFYCTHHITLTVPRSNLLNQAHYIYCTQLITFTVTSLLHLLHPVYNIYLPSTLHLLYPAHYIYCIFTAPSSLHLLYPAHYIYCTQFIIYLLLITFTSSLLISPKSFWVGDPTKHNIFVNWSISRVTVKDSLLNIHACQRIKKESTEYGNILEIQTSRNIGTCTTLFAGAHQQKV